MQFSLLVALLSFIGGSVATGSWKYGTTHDEVYGPADWGHVSKYCDGSSQSPVNIVTDDVHHDDGDHQLLVHFNNSLGFTNGKMTNNGHSPTFSAKSVGATLKNPINGQTYKLAQFHFHFGCDDSVGSEHTINGESYPGEMHLVFLNTKYPDVGTAATEADGLTVIGVFLEKERRGHPQLAKLAFKMTDISAEGATTPEFFVYLAHLVPDLANGEREYYSYKGSLTTPGCYESVSWLVLKKPIDASKRILKKFRKLKSTHGYLPGKMCNNFRPIQPLNGRKVTLHD